MRRTTAATVVTVAALLGGACAGDGTLGPLRDGEEGPAQIFLTDSPFPFDEVSAVEVYVVSVAAAAEADTIVLPEASWLTIAEPLQRFDLITLQHGTTALVGEGNLPVGVYKAIRMVIDADSSRIVMNDGTEAAVDWQRDGEIALHALVEDPLAVPVEGAQIVIDFDVGRSFLPVAHGFLFIPWIRAVNEAATGSVTGTVRGSNGPTEPLGPVANASVAVYRDILTFAPSNILSATGRTDAQGRYVVPYLTAGRYVVEVYPPTGFDAGTGRVQGVQITAGGTTIQDISLPPDAFPPTSAALYIYGPQFLEVGESAPFHADVIDADGDSVVTPAVDWWSSNQGIAAVSGSGSDVTVTGVEPGLALILATSLGLTDSILVQVGSIGPPVATIELSPATQTITVGDSTEVRATVRDAQGNIIPGRGVEWGVSDSTVVLMMVGFSADFVVLNGLAPGTATIVATSEGKSASATVTVQQ